MPKVFLYALSTCIHCKNTKKFLEENNVAFEYIYVDTLQGEERKAVISDIKKHNPSCSFPTVLIDDGATVIVGFRKEALKEALGL